MSESSIQCMLPFQLPLASPLHSLLRPRISKIYFKGRYFMLRVRDKNVSSLIGTDTLASASVAFKTKSAAPARLCPQQQLAPLQLSFSPQLICYLLIRAPFPPPSPPFASFSRVLSPEEKICDRSGLEKWKEGERMWKVNSLEKRESP